jgi:hypothetical protein
MKETDAWHEAPCDHCGEEPETSSLEGKMATVSVTVLPTDKPEHWRVLVQNPVRGTLIATTYRGGRWERAMAGGLRSADMYINALLCEDADLKRERLTAAQREKTIAELEALLTEMETHTQHNTITIDHDWGYRLGTILRVLKG